MSKNRNLKSPDHFGNTPPDVESLLRLAAPEDVSLDRDALMFQAGQRAVSRQHASHFVWPAIAATLLATCAGLGVALVVETRATRSLQLEVAALRPAQDAVGEKDTAAPRAPKAQQIGDSSLVSAPAVSATADPSVANQPRTDIATNSRLRDLISLASNSSLASGQLTAAGWQRIVPEPGAAADSPNDSQLTPAPRRPTTYRELLERYQEG